MLRVRVGLLVLLALGAALIAVDVLLLSGGVALPDGQDAGCSARAQRGAAGILSLRLGARRPTPLVTAGPVSGLDHPAVSPDGSRVAYVAQSNGIVGRLAVCDVHTGTLRTLRLPVGASDFPLSWDGRKGRLVFLGGDALGYGADQRPFAVGADGHGLRPLGGDSPWYWDGVAVSPDGTKLALLLQWKVSDGHEPEQLAVLDLRTGTLRRVAGSRQVAQIDGISWSPDGTRIVLTGYRANAHGALYAVDLSTLKLTPLLVRGPGARAPAWSPDGRSIAFVRGGRNASSIWLLDVLDGRTRRLTRGGVDLAPAWMPDGRSLVFVRRAAKVVPAAQLDR